MPLSGPRRQALGSTQKPRRDSRQQAVAWNTNLLPGEYLVTQGERSRTLTVTAGETSEFRGF